MAKKKTPPQTNAGDDDDIALWETIAEGITPLDVRAKNLARDARVNSGARPGSDNADDGSRDAPPPIPAPQGKTKPGAAPRPRTPTPPPPPTLSHGTVAGLDKRTAERMKRGQLKSEGRLDLHGMTQDEAHRALAAFIGGAHGAGKRQVMIITGKGEGGSGVLKTAVPRWLNGAGLREKIVAFDYAQPKDGGEGALYVRLRKPKNT